MTAGQPLPIADRVLRVTFAVFTLVGSTLALVGSSTWSLVCLTATGVAAVIAFHRDGPGKVGRSEPDGEEREAKDACERICVRAFQVIRASAYRREPCDAPEGFDGDYTEWIRLVADACDGLARPTPTATDALTYRRSAWNPLQAAWAEDALSV